MRDMKMIKLPIQPWGPAIQIAPVISTEEPKIVSNTTEELTPVHPLALTLFKSKKGKAQYKVNDEGETILMKRKKIREKFPRESNQHTYQKVLSESHLAIKLDESVKGSETRKMTIRKEVVSILVIQQENPHPSESYEKHKQSRTSCPFS